MPLAWLGVVAWRLFEVQPAPAPDRFVELHTINGGCLYPTTQIAVYDGAGTVLDAVAPVTVTTCYPADTYLLVGVPPAFPAEARQACLRSSGTIYDCVRWDGVTVPVHDLFGPDDDSAAAPPPSGYALARIGDTEVVADDWIVAEPTPGAPNDNPPVDPPDAGPHPDAAPPADAAPRPDASTDARASSDARDDTFLDLDAQGGAGCGCQGGADASALVALALLLLLRQLK
jgi:hypothetical protein